MNGIRLAACRAGTTVTVIVIGDLDMATTPDLATFVTKTLRDDDKRVSLDLTGLTFIDAGGLGVLVGLRNHAERRGTELLLINCPGCIRRLLRITGLDKRFALA